MKKHLSFIKTFCFLAGLIILINFLGKIAIPSKDSINRTTADSILDNIENNEGNVDVLLIGDSLSTVSINPYQLESDYGISMYIGGSFDQMLCTTEEIIEESYDTLQEKILILEVNNFYSNSDWESVSEYTLERAVPLVKYHDRWRGVFNANNPTARKTFSTQKGYVSSDTVKGCECSNYMGTSEKALKIPETNKDYVYNIAEFCESNDIKLIFASCPSTTNCSMIRHNAVAKLAEELNVEFVDLNLLNDQIGIDWSTDTRDNGQHLNNAGATKVTEFIGNYLKTLGTV